MLCIFSAPVVMIDSSDDVSLEIDEGKMVTFSCTARGVPQPSYTWFPLNIGITESTHTDSDGFYLVTSNLTIVNVMRTNTGIYTCIANNTGSTQSRKFTLTVNCKCFYRFIFTSFCLSAKVN